ncbi:MAG: hypothetical protein ACE5DX_05440 [Candidatus Dojkabacteria bacterium]
MALIQSPRFIIGDQTTRYTLESTYTGDGISSAIRVHNASQILLDVEYTMGAAEAGNSVELKVEFSNLDTNPVTRTPASTEWYQEAMETAVGGTVTVNLVERTFDAVSAAATYDRFEVAIPNAAQYVRVSIKETGVAANKGSASVKLVAVEDEPR